MSKNDDDLKFVFPENVDKDYTVWMGYTLKDLARLVPIVIGCVIFIIIPPNTLWWMVVKITIALMVLISVMAIMTIRPIANRKNITFIQHFKLQQKFNHRQRLFFIKSRKNND